MGIKLIQNYIDCVRNKKYSRMFDTINWLRENTDINSPIFDEILNHKKNYLRPIAQYEQYKNRLQNFLNTIDATKFEPAKGEVREHQIKLLNFAKDLIQKIEQEGLHPMLTAGCLIGAIRHKGYIPWDDDLDFDLMRDEYTSLKEIIKNKFHVLDKNLITGTNSLYAELDRYWQKHPDEIVFAEKPPCISAMYGGDLKKCLIIDFFPRDYISPDLSKEDYLKYWSKKYRKFKSIKNWPDVFKFYEKELSNKNIYTSDSNICAYGWGNIAFNDQGKFSYQDINVVKPYSKIKFEDTEFYTYNDIDTYLSEHYGNYMKIPAEMEITKYKKQLQKLSIK